MTSAFSLFPFSAGVSASLYPPLLSLSLSLSLTRASSPTCTLLLLSTLIQTDILRADILHIQMEKDRSLVFCAINSTLRQSCTTGENQLENQLRGKLYCVLDSCRSAALLSSLPSVAFCFESLIIFGFKSFVHKNQDFSVAWQRGRRK